MVPTTGIVPAVSYNVYAKMVVNSNRNYVLFITPALGYGQNPGLTLAPGATVALGNLFAINPGYLQTSFNLHGPDETSLGHLSGLRNLVFGLDTNQNDGIPMDVSVYGGGAATYGGVTGVDTLAAGATFTASGGSAYTMGVGAFNPVTAGYESQVQFPLGGLNSQPSIWKKGDSFLWIIQPNTNGLPYIYESGYIRDTTANTTTIIQEQTNNHPFDFSYCLSEVQVNVHSTSGLFINPTLTGSGSFAGLNYLGEPDSYSFGIPGPALGMPSYPTNNGTVVVYLPQGNYTLYPAVQSVNGGGGTSQTALQPFNLAVGCAQKIVVDATGGLQVQLNASSCSASTQAPIGGQVTGSNTITSITVSVNGGLPTVLCSNCGLDPSFMATVSLSPLQCANNTVTVMATDSLGNTASTTASIRFSTQAPVITSCPGNITVPCAGLPGTPVSFSGSAQSQCGDSLIVNFTPAAGSLFQPGTNLVTGIVTDACGRQSMPCSFTVTVVNTNSPVLNCPTNITVDCAGQSGAQVFFQVTATDGCDTNVTVSCLPPSGYLFPLGTNLVTCSARDRLGNTSFCNFPIYVRPAVMSITKTVTIQWCGGALQGADNLNGPWTDIPGATSPYTVASDKAKQFYRSH
jgi:hypothetical protein